ncbi:MAG TPA: 4-(cytidine 5'-diphospho)-2-C-methyl-D-erythritol kinase [Candidatus Binataceae bacterium]|nr:4-(cytidine 5'-diphospho)-2-C-methyl-D-erythritol kinase [Candidatus Binataceae bacterium]
MLREAAPAKINLSLHVGARRADGYRDLESLVVFADAGDMLTFERADELSLAIEGPFAGALGASTNVPGQSPSNPQPSWPAPVPAIHRHPSRRKSYAETMDGRDTPGHDEIGAGSAEATRNNLVLRAARALAAARGIAAKARIVLTKNLPVASGIGGGSADAAATLRGLNALWGLNASAETLRQIGLSLGSDVPVCIQSQPARMSGRGEIVEPAPGIPALTMVLANPGISVSTAEVFSRFTQTLFAFGGEGRMRGIATLGAFLEDLAQSRNDLESSAIEIAPVIAEVLAALRGNGALLARMSGSGATCFGIFETDDGASEAAACIAQAHPDWWCVVARTAAA